jgi:hypothetical protein
MGRAPLDLSAPEVAARLGVPVDVVDDWMERRLLPGGRGADGVRRVTRRSVTILKEARAIDRDRPWSPADWEALLERLAPVLRDTTSLRPSILGRLIDELSGILPR